MKVKVIAVALLAAISVQANEWIEKFYPGLEAGGKAGNSFYTSYTVVDGEGVLWFPDRKYHLYGHKIGPEWFE